MKNLVFPRIFLHCVALGFIVSGLLLSVGAEVQILSGTPESIAASLFFGVCNVFLFLLLPVISLPLPGDFYAPHDVYLLIGLERFSEIC